MRSPILAVLLLVLPAIARADAIDPFPGECPPGLRRGISEHSEVCLPTACEGGAACPSGSECRPISECWAPRPYIGGREPAPEGGGPRLRDRVIGLCASDGRCAEGRCSTRRQCEPTGSTPAWDPAERRWTGQTHVSSGCSVGGRPSLVPLALLALALLARRSLRA